MGEDIVCLVLRAALRHGVTVPSAEAAPDAVGALAGQVLDPQQFHAAIADCIAHDLIRDPIRLPEGSLQCHWRLELTPKGVAAARALCESP